MKKAESKKGKFKLKEKIINILLDLLVVVIVEFIKILFNSL
jgi:hypothetical protein